MMNNAKNRNSRSVSQDKEIYSDLTENDQHGSIHMSNKEQMSGKQYSYQNRSFKGSLHHSHSSSYKFRKKNRSRKDRTSQMGREYGMSQPDVIQEQYYDQNGQMIRRVSKLEGGYEDYSDDDFYDEDMEEICAIHRKELDMVCLEPDCETPVCSKCILVGDHKNHRYVEKEIFFRDLNKDKNHVMALQGEIENSEQQLKKQNAAHLVVERINMQREVFNQEIEAHTAKVLKMIETRKREVEREVKIYFEQLGEKLSNYVNETVDATQANREWKQQLSEALRQLNEKETDIESGFHFRKLNQRLKFEENAKRIISNIRELQMLIDKKLNECLGSFKLETNDIDQRFLKISKSDVSFKQDLRERMRIVFNNEMETQPTQQKPDRFGQEQSNFMNMVDDYQDKSGRDTDLMNDDFDLNNNLVSDLPEYGLKTQKNNMFGHQMNMQAPRMHGNQNMQFYKNQPPRRPEGGPEYGQRHARMYGANKEEDNFYSMSSINNSLPENFRRQDNRSRSISQKKKKANARKTTENSKSNRRHPHQLRDGKQ